MSRFPKLIKGLGIGTKECNAWKAESCLGGDRSIQLSYVPEPVLFYQRGASYHRRRPFAPISVL
jgi:hypothetical protein